MFFGDQCGAQNLYDSNLDRVVDALEGLRG
jgi:hypothetical protein